MLANNCIDFSILSSLHNEAFFEQSFLLAPILPLMIGWTTAKEQGFLVGLASSGVGLANAVTYPIAGLLCKYGGWRTIFYFAGAHFFYEISLSIFM